MAIYASRTGPLQGPLPKDVPIKKKLTTSTTKATLMSKEVTDLKLQKRQMDPFEINRNLFKMRQFKQVGNRVTTNRKPFENYKSAEHLPKINGAQNQGQNQGQNETQWPGQDDNGQNGYQVENPEQCQNQPNGQFQPQKCQPNNQGGNSQMSQSQPQFYSCHSRAHQVENPPFPTKNVKKPKNCVGDFQGCLKSQIAVDQKSRLTGLNQTTNFGASECLHTPLKHCDHTGCHKGGPQSCKKAPQCSYKANESKVACCQ